MRTRSTSGSRAIGDGRGGAGDHGAGQRGRRSRMGIRRPVRPTDTDFGIVVQGSPAISRTFTVRNDGTATLTLGAVTVPAGFTLTEGLSAQSGAGGVGYVHGAAGYGDGRDQDRRYLLHAPMTGREPVQLPDHGRWWRPPGPEIDGAGQRARRSRMAIRRPVRPTTRTLARSSRPARRSVAHSRFIIAAALS